ncbi:MAG: zinc ribbon domain-containing protein [Nitrososphaerota archaeon]|nr:zinc ribbon domain-containing protein [Nitrososphaerota archaeon]
MKCPKCNTTTSGSEDFCTSCGQKLTVTCEACGNSWRYFRGYEFCPACGTKVGGVLQQQ